MTSKEQQCPQCTSVFTCGTKDGDKTCWCQSYPPIFEAKAGQTCLCSTCLTQEIAAKLPRYLHSLDHEQALALAQNYSSNAPLQEGIDYVMDNELMVFSAWFHLKRGYCCGNGCVNCPYPKDE